MGAVQVSDELLQVIEGQVAQGRAESPSVLLEEAVRRFVDEGLAEEDDVRRAAEAGIADAEAGRVTIVATSADERVLQERLMSRLQAGLAADE